MTCRPTYGGITRSTGHQASVPYVLATKSMPKMSKKQTGQDFSFVTSCILWGWTFILYWQLQTLGGANRLSLVVLFGGHFALTFSQQKLYQPRSTVIPVSYQCKINQVWTKLAVFRSGPGYDKNRSKILKNTENESIIQSYCMTMTRENDLLSAHTKTVPIFSVCWLFNKNEIVF